MYSYHLYFILNRTVGCKCHLVDEVNTVYAEHNGVTDRKNAVMRELYINGLSHGKPVGIQTPEEWDLALENKKNSLPLLDKFKVTNVDTRANSIDNSSLSKTTNRTEKDPRLELVSGVDMFGETTSENYSSPSSPRLNGRESFESEEKDRGCDSICEEFMKLENKTDFISCHGTRVVTGRPTAQVAPVFNDSGTCSEISLNASEFQHTAVKSCSQCNVQSGAQETEHDGSCSVATVDRKPSEMHVADAVCSSDVTEAPVLSFSRSGKEAELASSSSLVGPAAFVTRAVQAGCSHQAQTIRMATSHLDSNVCTTMGLQPPGSTNQGSSTVFISVQPGNMPESPSVASDSTPTAVVTNAFGLSSLLSQNEGTSGMNLQSNNLKGLVASPGLPGTPFAYALPGALFPTSVLPTQSTGILNSTAAASPPPPAVAVGQVQSGSAVSVPVHTPDPAHSPSLTYSAASGENASYINCLGNSPNRTVLPQQPVGSGACNSCGRGCSCGTRSGDMNFYYPAPQGQHYRLQVFPFPSVCNSSYLSQAHQNSGTQLPFFLPQAPYANGLIPDPLLGSQASYGIQQMAGFQRYYYPMFQAPVVVPNANGLVPKKNGIMSCCNCGASGHFSPDCKQPPMEASQQGENIGYSPGIVLQMPCAEV
ncbi:zinc finger CCHC domain-containing protein 2 [Protopterus annectens]|uniref:zinc finger CCHC domain-containing protein 2 n=1 Tax=Protopterus annectens TaxID=7888 RepID=UPI001CFB9E1A|nr:zinc finger CCHC domain-containing protein 2 [Protopterus annectens]